ncbi:MAG TPA: ABC transporter ATP-binding protein [Candidatus Limnocylindrales bacterium]
MTAADPAAVGPGAHPGVTDIGRHPKAAAGRPLIVLDDVTKHFPVSGGGLLGRKEVVHAIDGVTLTVREGEVMGLVGETGSGKSTLARLILKLITADGGQITFDGQDVLAADRGQLKALRREMQLIFQDPFSALDPSMKLGQSIEAPLSQHNIGDKASRKRMVAELLDKVGLPASFAERYPSECSGGQLHRVVIARALSLGPRFLACDEPTSSLDASIRAQILNLLVDLRDQLGLTLLLISHDLRVVRYISDRVAVMYLGRIVELGSRDDIFEHPLHPYTQKLIAASLPERAGEDHAILQGEPPSPINPPSGCRFRERCPLAIEACKELPPFEPARPGHSVACIRWQDAAASW